MLGLHIQVGARHHPAAAAETITPVLQAAAIGQQQVLQAQEQ